MPQWGKNVLLTLSVMYGIDLAFAALGLYVSSKLAYPYSHAASFGVYFRMNLPLFLVFSLTWVLVANRENIYASQRGSSILSQLQEICKVLAISLSVTGFASVYLPAIDEKGRGFLLLIFCITTAAQILLFRLFVRLFLMEIRRYGYNTRNIVVVGANERTKRLIGILRDRAYHGYSIAGILDDDEERIKDMESWGVQSLGKFQELERLIKNRVVDEVYISLPVRSCYEMIVNMASLCESAGIPVRVVADMFSLKIATNRFYLLYDIPIQSLSPIPESSFFLFIKRVFDFISSTVGLIFLIPLVFIPVAILIKLDSKGPVFFGQERVGMNGRRFKMYKFRSMVINAEELKKSLEAQNEKDGPIFKMANDPRVTRVGRFIRKTSIDELPQLFNVWTGKMSLVGPRPPLPDEVEKYTWNQRRRLSVKPGITGLWQVSGRSELSFEEWVKLDLSYIDNWSIWYDLKILLKTIKVVLSRQGAA